MKYFFMKRYLETYLLKKTEAAPLAVFRVLFGFMMLGSILRFYSKGWIESLYLTPKFFFSYSGFEWVKPVGAWTYLIFIICGLSAFFVAIGFKYRWAIIAYFLSFTYIELMDKTTYLNHYYFVSSVSFLMIFLPANAYFSVDAYRNRSLKQAKIPQWNIDSVKVILGIVYFYAGLAKLNSEWLIHAQPLSIWLPAKAHLPVIGPFLTQKWVHYFFSWSGAVYDLTIPFLLLFRRTRFLAYLAVIAFHVLTGWIFPIGMFPYIMIVSTLIFFPPKLHHTIILYAKKVVALIQSLLGNVLIHKDGEDSTAVRTQSEVITNKSIWRKLQIGVVGLFLAFHLLFPFRHLGYPDELFWTEEGFRFSWRVMLMEKIGYAQFKVVDAVSGKWVYVKNNDFLTAFQEKQMAFQPDFIVEFAHFLAEHYKKQGMTDPAVYVESYVALNGRLSRQYIDPKVDLTKVKDSFFKHKDWVLPFNDEIHGL